MQFGVWLPVYGSWLRTLDLPAQGSAAACLDMARLAETVGYDFVYASENLLNPVHGPTATVIDAWSILAAVAASTHRIGLCGAIKPGFRSALQAARMIDTVSSLARRPMALGIVCGWWQEEFDRASVAWLDHGGRYDRADAFLSELNTLFETGDVGLDPGHRPEAWIAGHSSRALNMVARTGGCMFLNGMDDAALTRQIAAIRAAEIATGHKVTIAINAHVICAATTEQAQARLDGLIQRRDHRSIAYFRQVMQDSGAESWRDLSDAEMVDSNAGFAAGLIGDPASLRTRLRDLQGMGVDRVLCQFDDPAADAVAFMSNVVAPVRTALSEEPVR